MLRPLVLCAPGIANDFVVASLSRFAPVCIVREEPPPLAPILRVLRRRRDPLLARLDKLAFFAFYALVLRAREENALRAKLGTHPEPGCDLRVAQIDQALAKLDVRRLAPDLILVLGTSILSPAWMQLGVPVVNVHTGLAPRYRGRFCWLWPLLEGHPDQVGVTLHLIEGAVDNGRILAQRVLDPDQLGTGSFADVLHPVTLAARDACHALLEQTSCESLGAGAVTASPAHRAYLEPGLSDYLRARARHRRAEGDSSPPGRGKVRG